MEDLWTAVDRYFEEGLIPRDEGLEAALANNAAASLPAIDVAPNQGRLLQLLAQMQGAKTILEIGTLGGYSTIWLARALPEGGRLVSLELSPEHARVAQQNIVNAGLAAVVEIRVGRAVDSLAALVAEGQPPFDFIFIDADKPSYTDYLAGSLELSRPGTVIIADNVVRGGGVASAESRDASVLGVRRFTERLATESRLSATAIQTVGRKGYDGFVLARVNDT